MMFSRNTKAVLSISAMVLLAACASEPKVDTSPEARNAQGLSPVSGTSISEVFVDHEANFKGFKQYQIVTLDTSDVEVSYKPSSGQMRGRDWTLTDDDRQWLQEMYAGSMNTELLKKGYTLVDAPSEGVLVVQARLKRLEPTAPRDDAASRPVGRSHYYTEGSGKMTIEIVFSDGASQKVVATVVDRKDAGTHWSDNNAVRNRADVKRLFNRWASQLGRSLDRVHAKQ